MRTAGFLLQPTYRVRDGQPVIQLFGRLENGPAFLVEEDRFRPYFFARASAADRLRGASGCSLAPSDLRALDGDAVVRVDAELPGDVVRLRERLAPEDALESDVRFPYRFLTDLGIRAGLEIDGVSRTDRRGLVRFHNPTLRPADVRPVLHMLSIDLETTPDASHILSAALVGSGENGADEVHLVAAQDVARAVTHRDETSLLRRVLERIAEIDPDVLLGWNVVDFDLRVLVSRCEACGVRTPFGRVPGNVLFQADLGFSRQTRATIPGRVVLDGIPLVRDALRLPDYRLETVGQAVLGRGKLIDKSGGDAGAEIQRMYRDDPASLVAYNREDARLVLDVLEAESLLDLTIERSLLSGMPLDRVGASIASFDRIYLPELRRAGRVAPSVDGKRKSALVRGGALIEAHTGFHRDVAVYDFKSLYPSLIRTFQLDPLAHALADASGIEAPNGARFAREGALLPGLIDRFMAAREAAKARNDRHADQAIKIMMNALFGVLGAGSCRFFDGAIANAITSFGQQTLHWTRDAFAEAGHPVLYGDTDSVFVQLDDPGTAADLRDHVQHAIAERVRATYRVEPRLDLELEKIYDRLFLPRVRGGRSASSKRYAGWLGGSLEIVGLESVRRDWPAITRTLQEGMLERLFRDQPVQAFVREIAEEVRAGARDSELVYVKRVRKASLEKYTATTPPHVQAARKLGGRAGPVIRYVVTASGPEPVVPGQPLPPAIDYRHYIDKVLRPVADSILVERDESFDEAMGEPKQLSLL